MSKQIDWKKYDNARPKISVRIAKKDKQALDAALQQRGESLSELFLNCIEPVITQYKNELLYAAAPEMLDALEALVNTAINAEYDQVMAKGYFSKSINDALEVIAKAKGEQP